MKIVLWLIAICLVFGCASVNTNYIPNAKYSRPDAIQIFEQVVMEQAPAIRPQGIYVSDQYIGFDFGEKVDQQSTGVVALPNPSIGVGVLNSESTIKQVTDRIYLNSIGQVSVYKKGNFYIIDLVNERNELYRHILTRSEEKAKAFADAVESLKTKKIF